MALKRGMATGITFPAEVITDEVIARLSETTYGVFATHVVPHIPFIPGFNRYWIEWSSLADFSNDIHVAGLIEPHEGFDQHGDFFDGEITGFAPGSTWYFRACASSAGEYPPVSPEQWNQA